VKRRIGFGVLVVGALLSGCSTTTTGSSTTTTARGSLDATPCNYAQAWHDNPTQFSEFATLARFARMAASSQLQAEGRHLTSAVASDDASTTAEVAGAIFVTCRQLGLVKTPTASSTTG
jgi:hypothetical protein